MYRQLKLQLNPRHRERNDMEIAFSLLVAIVGLIIFVLSSTPKPQEIGKIMFLCGLLAFLLVAYTGHLFTIVAR